jgi:hypothetical protein
VPDRGKADGEKGIKITQERDNSRPKENDGTRTDSTSERNYAQWLRMTVMVEPDSREQRKDEMKKMRVTPRNEVEKDLGVNVYTWGCI